jgi:excisionase family DNA binding protein
VEQNAAVLFIRPAEAAKRLSISVRKTYQLLASGELPSRRFGQSLRVPVAAIEKMARDAGQDGDGK